MVLEPKWSLRIKVALNIIKITFVKLLPYSTLSSPPPKRPLLCQTRRGGLDKGDFYFPKFTFKKFWKKNWVNQIFKICYEYINNNSCIDLDDGNRIRIVWSCSSNAIKIHNVSYIPFKNFWQLKDQLPKI